MLIDLLTIMIERGSSDLYLSTGAKPKIRKDGILIDIDEFPALSPEETKDLCYSILSDYQKETLESNYEINLSFGIKGLSRFRASIFIQRGAVAGTFRAVPFNIRSIDELGLPPQVKELTTRTHGIVIVSGPRSSGKSTTLASMIDAINSTRKCHIITLEDTIEFLHSHKEALVNQREMNDPSGSLLSYTKGILRQDPDVVLFGEIGEPESVEAVLMIAETGRLVLAGMTTPSAALTIKRITEVFPPHRHEQIRYKLSTLLEGIISQQLLPRKDTRGRVVATEVFIPTAAVRSLIRDDNLKQVYSLMQGLQGMQTMNQSLMGLYERGIIDRQTAVDASPVPEELNLLLNKNALINRAKLKLS